MRWPHGFLLAALAIAAWPFAGHAFWSKSTPLPDFPGSSKPIIEYPIAVHQQITSRALGRIAVSSPFATGPGIDNRLRFTPHAIERTNFFNEFADIDELYEPHWHFDNETLKESFDRIVDLRRYLLDELRFNYGPTEDVRWHHLGYILHAVQDFYSHSN